MNNEMMTSVQAINQAMHIAMEMDSSVIAYGLGIDDPKTIFGTTSDLQERFGQARVFDTPTSENAMTGIGVGAALGGLKPVMCHQRLDFFLLALDQLVNNAAKWRYTFGEGNNVPITIRLILGRGWGQGPTHSQNLQAWFAHIPGLKVVMPSTPADAKGLLLSSIFDPDPVVYLEHRWIHHALGNVPTGDYRTPIGKARVAREGKDLTIVAMSYLVAEAHHACAALAKIGIECELIDLVSIKPLDFDTIKCSLKKTGRLLVLDTGPELCSISSEIIAHFAMHHLDLLRSAPQRLASPDCPEPTSYALSKVFYIDAMKIMSKACDMLAVNEPPYHLLPAERPHHDVPGDWFTGPF